MGSSLNTLFDPNSLPSRQEGETLAQYAMRTAGLTGFNTSGLGGFLSQASSMGANPDDWAGMIRQWQERMTGQMSPEEAAQWGYPSPPPPTDTSPPTGVLGPPSVTGPVTQGPGQTPPPGGATPMPKPPLPPGGTSGPAPPLPLSGPSASPGAFMPGPAAANPNPPGMGITPPGGFQPGMGPGQNPQAAGTFVPPKTMYPGNAGGPLPTIDATSPRAMPAPPGLPPPRSLQPTPPMNPGQAPISRVGQSSSLNDNTFNGLSQQRLAQLRALSQSLAAPEGIARGDTFT